MQNSSLGLQRIKGIALSVSNLSRANRFYSQTLELPPAIQGSEQFGWLLGDTILMLKENWYAPPTESPNPRITMLSEDAQATEKELRARGVRISDPVERFNDAYVGSFLDSEGNKLWFCSPVS